MTKLSPGNKNITEPVEVEATDLDIRDLDKATDSVSAEVTNTVSVTLDESIDVTLDEPIDTNSTIVSPTDDATGAVETIDYAHHEVHSGRHFTFSAYDSDLDIGGTLEFIVTTPDTTRWSHLVGTITGALHTDFEFFEDTTHTTGAAQNVYNNNRNSANAAGTTVHLSNDNNADGTLLFSTSFGIDTGSGNNLRTGGGGSRAENEWMLKQNTKYLFRLTSQATNNNCALVLSWYEHQQGS